MAGGGSGDGGGGWAGRGQVRSSQCDGNQGGALESTEQTQILQRGQGRPEQKVKNFRLQKGSGMWLQG